MSSHSISIALTDTSEGQEASPRRIRLEALEGFTADVSVLLKGQGNDVDPAKTHVSVTSMARPSWWRAPALRLSRELEGDARRHQASSDLEVLDLQPN